MSMWFALLLRHKKRYEKNRWSVLIGIGKRTERGMCAIVTFSSVAQVGSRAIWDRQRLKQDTCMFWTKCWSPACLNRDGSVSMNCFTCHPRELKSMMIPEYIQYIIYLLFYAFISLIYQLTKTMWNIKFLLILFMMTFLARINYRRIGIMVMRLYFGSIIFVSNLHLDIYISYSICYDTESKSFDTNIEYQKE